MLTFQFGLILSFSGIIIPALTGLPNVHNINEFLSLTGTQASWIGKLFLLFDSIQKKRLDLKMEDSSLSDFISKLASFDIFDVLVILFLYSSNLSSFNSSVNYLFQEVFCTYLNRWEVYYLLLPQVSFVSIRFHHFKHQLDDHGIFLWNRSLGPTTSNDDRQYSHYNRMVHDVQCWKRCWNIHCDLIVRLRSWPHGSTHYDGKERKCIF